MMHPRSGVGPFRLEPPTSPRRPRRRGGGPRAVGAFLMRLARSVATVASIALPIAMAQGEDAPVLQGLYLFDRADVTALEQLQDGTTVAASTVEGEGFSFEAQPAAGAVGSVRFQLDGQDVFVDNAAPFVLPFQANATGMFTLQPEAAATTIEAVIQSSEDDAEEFLAGSSANAERFPAGYTYVESSDLELGADPGHAEQAIGLRFTSANVPPDVEITHARLLFVARGSSDGPLSLSIRGQAAVDAPAFEQDPDGSGQRGISTRPTTSASAAWDLAEQGAWSANDEFASADVTAVMQELVEQPGWTADSPLVFVITHLTGDGYRRAYAYDDDPDLAARLQVTYASADTTSASFAWGRHTLTAIPYREPGASGAAGPPVEVDIEIVQEPTGEPPAEPGEAPDAPDADPDAPDAEPDPEDAAADAPPADAGGSSEGAAAGAGADADAAAPGADAEAPPADALGAPDQEVGEPVAAAAPAGGPADEPDVPAEAELVQRERYAILPLGGSGVSGTTLVSAYDGVSTVLTVNLTPASAGASGLELWRGTCGEPVERLAELAPLRPGIGSVTPIAISFRTLRLGRLSILVIPPGGGEPLACSELTATG